MKSTADRTGLQVLVDQAADWCARLDPDTIDTAEVTAVHGLLGRLERLASGAATRIARRLTDTDDWRDAGDRSPEHHRGFAPAEGH